MRLFRIVANANEGEDSMRYLPGKNQMKAADQYTIDVLRVPSLELMERASRTCVDVMEEQELDLSNVLIVCGSGNNGGDGFAIGRMLADAGHRVSAYLAGNPEHLTKECAVQMERFQHSPGCFCEEYPEGEYSIIVDALFGVGLARNIEGSYADVVYRMNQAKGAKFAVDVPSGVCADSGNILGCAFRADLTVTFQAAKRGLYLYPGQFYTGKLVVRDIGISEESFAKDPDMVYTCGRSDYRKLLPKRSEDSNKGTYGRLLIIAGSKGMSGAAYLNAKAAYRMGAGLVRIYTHKSNRVILQTLLPEAIVTTYKEYDEKEVQELLCWADTVCIGSGIGTGKTARRILKKVILANDKPCVIDADGINLLARHTKYRKYLRGKPYILTPHMKEMSRLVDRSIEEIRADRFAILQEYLSAQDITCVLKDSRTAVSGKGQRTYLNLSGNSALAKGGSGDVLAGMIAGLLAQKLGTLEASVLGVYLHGRCADLARMHMGSRSVLASELIDNIGNVWMELEE